MKRIRFQVLALAVLALLPTASIAQQPSVNPNGVVNAASYALNGMPNSGIAQGSIFFVLGTNLGTAGSIQVSTFPLPSSQGLGGTSIRVTVGSTTVDCLMLYRTATRIAAVLPSNTPVGSGTLRVTFNGQTSAPAAITVVRSSFGIFTLNQAGSGPGILQIVNSDTNQPLNTLTEVAHPGQMITLWGTGLGPVSGNEAAGPLPGDLTSINVKVWVGVLEATVTYRGRAECCVGIDQIKFIVPAGVTGCYVSVAVQIDNVISNYVSMAVAGSGSTCSDPTGFSASEVSDACARGSMSLCAVSLTRLSISFTEPGQPPFDFKFDTGGTVCIRYTCDQFVQSQGGCVPPAIGSCKVSTFQTGSTVTDPIAGTGLNAGPVINVNGPNGAKQMTPVPLLPGFYTATLSDPFNPLAVGYLDPGTYTINNGGGASGANTAGPFQATHVVSSSLVWTNKDSITTVNRSQGVTVTWTGGAANGYVGIYGSSTNALNTAGALFTCFVSAAAGSFTVPPSVLLALPPSNPNSTEPSDILAVGSSDPPTRFTATGIDTGFVNSTVQTAKTLVYQ